MKRWHARTVVYVVLATVAALALLWLSCQVNGWRRDVLLNAGFVVIAALFTAMIVDVVVRHHDDARWKDAREVSWIRLRRLATTLISAVAKYYPNPGDVAGSQSFIPRAQAAIDTDQAGHFLYSDPNWIKHIRDDAIPDYWKILEELEVY